MPDETLPLVTPDLLAKGSPQDVTRGLDQVSAQDSAATTSYTDSTGGHLMDVSAASANYRTADGSWAPIDPTLQQTEAGWSNTAGPDQLTFPTSLGKDTPLTLTLTSGTLSISPAGVEGASATVKGTTATYADALKGTDLVYESLTGGFKESIVLRSPPAGGSFSWTITATGLTLRAESSGEISVLYGDQVVASLSPPLVTDAGSATDGTDSPVNFPYKLTDQGNGSYGLDVVYDSSYLNDPGRVYPVTIDPVYNTDLSVGSDSKVDGCAGDGNTNYSSSNYLAVAGSCPWRSFLQFNTSSIQHNNRIVYGAQLDLYRNTTGGDDTEVRRVTSGWAAGTVTWNNQPSVDTTTSVNIAGVVNGWQTWNIGKLYQQIIDNTSTDNGIRLGAASYNEYASKNSGTGGHLFVSYNDLPGSPTLSNPPTASTINVESPTLSVTSIPTDLNNDDVKVQFQISDNGTDWTGTHLVDSSPWTDGKSWAVDAGVLKDGQTYYWRAQSGDVCGSGICSNVDATNTTHPWNVSGTNTFNVNLPHLGDDQRWAMWSTSLGNNMSLKINQATGNAYLDYPLDSLQTSIGPLDVSLTYNSDSTTDLGMGAGWNVSAGPMSDGTQLPISLVKLNDNKGGGVNVTFKDGGVQHFSNVAGNDYTGSGENGGTVEFSPGASGSQANWTYTTGNGGRYTFDNNGKPLAAKPTSDDWSKPGYSYVFDANQHITSVTDPLGRAVTFTWTGSPVHLTSIGTWDSRTWNLSYSSNKLWKVTDPDSETVAYTYDGTSGLLGGIQDGQLFNDGSQKTSIGYSTSTTTPVPYQATSVTAPSAANATQFGYGTPLQTGSSIVNETTVTDPRGVATSSPTTDYETWTDFNTAGLPTRIFGPYDNASVAGTTFMVWDTNGNLVCSRSPQANAVSLGDGTNHKCYMSTGVTLAQVADVLNTDYVYQTLAPFKMLSETGPAPNADGTGTRAITTYGYDEGLTGFQSQQWDNAQLSGTPDYETIYQQINSDWCGGGGSCHPAHLTDPTFWSLRDTGMITVGTTGRYWFRLKADDGSRLIIGQKDMVECWSDPHNFQSNCGTGDVSKQLDAGVPTPITVEYYNANANSDGTGARLELWWDQGNGSWQLVPSSIITPNLNLVTSVADPLGTTTYSYPGYQDQMKGLPVSKTRGSRSTTYTYDDYGRTLTQTDALSHTTTYHYTDTTSPAYSCMDQVTDPTGAVTNYTCNGAGDVLVAKQTVRAVSGTNQSTQQVRDVTKNYDLEGRLLSTSVPYADGGSPSKYVLNTYDKAGRLKTVTDPMNNVTTYVYNAQGYMTQKTLPDPDGAGSLTSPVYNYVPDPVGNVTQMTDPRSKQWNYTYDALNRQLSATDPTSAVTATAYSLANRTASVTDPAGATSTTAFDLAGRKASAQVGTYTATTYGYDAVGNLTQVNQPWDATNKPFDKRVYNQFSQMTTETQPTGASGALQDTNYVYDNAGNLSSVQDANAYTTSYTYDNDGRLLTSTLPSPMSNVTTLVYDDAGERVKVTDGAGNVRQWAYDVRGQASSLQDGRGTSSYAYDDNSRVTGVTLPSSTPALPIASQYFTYDNLGRQSIRCGVTSSGSATSCASGTGRVDVERYSYDAANNMTGATSDASSSTNLAMAYDNAGRICAVVQGGGSASCGMGSGSGITTYAYTNGKLTTLITPAGTTTYTYLSGSGFINTVQDPFASTAVTYGYDTTTGQQTSRADPDGVTTKRTYDPAGRISCQVASTSATSTCGNGSSIKASFALTYDPVGNVTSDNQYVSTYATSEKGTWNYTYDHANRLKTSQDPGGTTTTYGYNGDGSRSSVQVGGGTAVTTSYDSAGYPTSASDGTTYTTDALGELTKVVKGASTKNYGFDSWGRMTSGNGGTFVYGPLDQTASTTVSGTTTSYSYVGTSQDPAQSVTGSNSTKFAYTPGEPLAQKSTGGTAQYLLTNLHDDIVGLAKLSDGSVVGTASFDPWGTVRATSGSSTSLLGFQGQLTDPSTGFTDMGTRYYDPAEGRFTTKDSVFGNPTMPLSLNQFTYANGNPVTFTDPNGMCTDPSMCPPPVTATHKVRQRWSQLQNQADANSWSAWYPYGTGGGAFSYIPPQPKPPPPAPKPPVVSGLACGRGWCSATTGRTGSFMDMVHGIGHVFSAAGSWAWQHKWQLAGVALSGLCVAAGTVVCLIGAGVVFTGKEYAAAKADGITTKKFLEDTGWNALTTGVSAAAGAAPASIADAAGGGLAGSAFTKNMITYGLKAEMEIPSVTCSVNAQCASPHLP